MRVIAVGVKPKNVITQASDPILRKYNKVVMLIRVFATGPIYHDSYGYYITARLFGFSQNRRHDRKLQCPSEINEENTS